ncbi:CGNR zinc finger domain-containing protein [Luteibacter sp.]|jgi:predicted RNA-binding Zn ribbon-like protein|uniref:CGNR zinc finger domain-containing protein n=1 Tax=Luteibacter sp. TaxID=1886636 RepID=UPI002F3F890B
MSQSQPVMLIADAPGLDFLNSLATPVDVMVDWIDDGEGLLAWLGQTRMVPVDVLADMRRRAMPGELDRLADQARSLREWFRAFVREKKGHALDASSLKELDPLNLLLARDEGYAQVVASDDSGHLKFVRTRRWTSPESLLQPIGEAMAKLVAEEDFTHIKACEGPTCTLLFADHTRGHVRRWCSMAACGNRAKQNAHRRRTRPSL